MSGKQRLSASVDAELLAAAEAATARGDAPTLSAWISDAMRLKLELDRRLQALALLIADHEATHGEITHVEIEQAERRARHRASSVRGLRASESRVRSPRHR